MVGSQDTEWLQGALKMFISLFRRNILKANVTKYNAMTFQPGTLRYGMLEEAVGLWCIGRGATYRERLIMWIPFPDFGVELTAGSMTGHRRRIHDTEIEINWNRLPVIQMEHIPQVFGVSFPKGTTQ